MIHLIKILLVGSYWVRVFGIHSFLIKLFDPKNYVIIAQLPSTCHKMISGCEDILETLHLDYHICGIVGESNIWQFTLKCNW